MTTTLGESQATPHRLPADFHRLFAAKTLSVIGTNISKLAIPLLAIAVLDASPGQVGLIATLSTISFLVIGLPAGAWVDRVRRRGVMIAADLVRALLLASLPVAWWLDVLSLNQLYVVVVLVGAATVFFDVAAMSFVPQLVGRDNLVPANSRLVTVEAAGGVAGQGGGGAIVQLLTAPIAILVDALTYLWSAGWLIRIRHREQPDFQGTERRLVREMRDGVAFVVRQPILRAVAIDGAITNLSMQLIQVMVPVLLVSELGLSAGLVGLFFVAGGVGIVAGSLIARKLGSVVGDGRMLWLVAIMIAPFGFLVPLVDRGALLWLAMAGWFVVLLKVGVDNVLKVSFRQRVTPDRMLGRMAATMRFMLTGALAVGAAMSGVLGEFGSPRVALWAGAIGLATAWIPIFFSPLRTVRRTTDVPAAS